VSVSLKVTMSRCGGREALSVSVTRAVSRCGGHRRTESDNEGAHGSTD
jgi:hypothetical protein